MVCKIDVRSYLFYYAYGYEEQVDTRFALLKMSGLDRGERIGSKMSGGWGKNIYQKLNKIKLSNLI